MNKSPLRYTSELRECIHIPNASAATQFNMSIYLAALSSNPAATHPLFKQRGIEGLTHASINQLGIHGRPFLREAAYDGYIRNIDVFLAATNSDQRKPTYTEDAELKMDRINTLIPIELPRLFLLPARELTPDQQDTFMHRVRESEPIKQIQGKTTTFILAKPDIRKAMTYLNASKEGAIASEGTWTPGMFASMAFLVTVITEFLKTNTYPAFLNENNRGEFDGGEFMLSSEDLATARKSMCEEVRCMRGGVDVYMGEDYDDEDEDAIMEDNAVEIGFSTMRKAVLVAKPSPLPLSYNIGSPAEVPKLPGRVFPYFDKMNIPDNYTIRSVVSSFFLRNLGETREAQIGQFKAFKNSWERLSKTKQGGELVHMLVGIRLALETQTRLFLVYRDDCYAGFVLLGALWSVSVDGRMYEWESAEKVQEQVSLMSSHEYAVRIICEELSKLEVMIGSHAGPAVTVVKDDVTSALAMWDKIKERKFSVAAEEKVKSVLGLVSYSRSYREVCAESLAWLFRAVGNPNEFGLEETDPLFLPPTFSMYHDRLFQLLCSFGPDAPSLYNTSGAIYDIPPASKEDPNNVLNQKGEKALPMILVSLKSVQVAVQDLNKVLKDRAVRINLSERAGRNRNIALRGDHRDRVYNALKDCLDKLEKTGDKRKNTETRRDKRARAIDLNTADDFLNLF